MSVYSDQPYPNPPGCPDYLDVGWVGYTGVWQTQETIGMSANIYVVSAAPAGDNFKSGDPTAPVSAHFVTRALYTTKGGSPSTTNEATFHVQVWSYPVALPVQ